LFVRSGCVGEAVDEGVQAPLDGLGLGLSASAVFDGGASGGALTLMDGNVIEDVALFVAKARVMPIERDDGDIGIRIPKPLDHSHW